MTVSHLVAILASEGGPKTIWDPTILGVLVTLSGLVLFAGSTYLLLATNVGARLGFMITAAGLSGIMVLLSCVWLITQTPLNSPKGRIQRWVTVKCDEPEPKCALIDNLSEAKIGAISALARTENPKQLDLDKYQSLRSAVDAMLLKVKDTGHGEGESGPYATYDKGSDVLTQAPVDANGIPNKFGTETLKEYIVGGKTDKFFWHTPKYAAVEICDAAPQASSTDPNVKPAAPGCDETKAHKWALFIYDYGSIRLPALMYLLGSLVFFGISLYALHSRELAQRRIAAAGAKVAMA